MILIKDKTSVLAILYAMPFAVWMALMFTLPPTAESYALRSVASLAAGVICWILYRRSGNYRPIELNPGRVCISAATGIAAGITVFALWISLPVWPYAAPVISEDLPYAPTTCGWGLTIVKLIGSAFVIAPAEEIFFRSFLYRRLITRDFTSIPVSRFDLSAFMWVVLLFTLEHNRPIAAAVTGVVYGLLSVRFGIFSAIAAHVTTNFVLGLYVIFRGEWQFW